ATVINMRFVKPLDEALVKRMAENHTVIVTVEENAIAGGAGSAVNEYLQASKLLRPTLNLGLPDSYTDQGSREELLEICQLDVNGIQTAIEKFTT
ncbi:MAG: transketolase C-terminal domain-containing protein, partial [Methylococcaceae bacterium]|nr:transketolase C-terminal domain-containing protein [Methylococcaceae bacterium]